MPWVRLFCAVVFTIFGLWLIWSHPLGREIVLGGIRLLAGLLSTPFILEGAWFCIGAFALYLYTLRRRDKEGDEWVIMEVEDPPGELSQPSTPTRNQKENDDSHAS